MPFYGVVPGVNFTTSGIANTETDALFVRPGAAVPTRNVYLTGIQLQGKSTNATSLSGIEQRIKKWTTTASSGGTAITPSPRDTASAAAKSTAGQASAGVTSGTGGPVLQLIVGCSVSGPGQWSYLNNLDVAPMLEGGANQSIDLFNIAGAVSLAFAVSVDISE
jgi:hypothetical protein